MTWTRWILVALGSSALIVGGCGEGFADVIFEGAGGGSTTSGGGGGSTSTSGSGGATSSGGGAGGASSTSGTAGGGGAGGGSGTVDCDGQVCSPNEVCCGSESSMGGSLSCMDPNQCNGVIIDCDDSSDCPAQDLCCFDYGEISCEPSCSGGPGQGTEVCTSNEDCAQPTVNCCPLIPNTSGPKICDFMPC